MVLKISRGVWFVSVLGALGALLICYAALPEEVFLIQEEVEYISVSRESFFYLALGLITLVNSLVFIVGFLYKKGEDFRTWFNGLVITLNIFFVITLFFINVTNGTERFDYSRIGILIYGSVGLVGLWALAWPMILVFRKFLFKHSV